ncbi:unnamed protein product, partial [Amoebophrya sp. A25]
NSTGDVEDQEDHAGGGGNIIDTTTSLKLNKEKKYNKNHSSSTSFSTRTAASAELDEFEPDLEQDPHKEGVFRSTTAVEESSKNIKFRFWTDTGQRDTGQQEQHLLDAGASSRLKILWVRKGFEKVKKTTLANGYYGKKVVLLLQG